MSKVINTIIAGILLAISADDEPDPYEVERLNRELEIAESSRAILREKASKEKLIGKVEKESKVRLEKLEKKRREEERRRKEEERRRLEEMAKLKNDMQTVRFTNFYVGDGTGSGTNTSVGLTVNDFGINENGWYTYQGKVVIATATTLCLDVKTGPCGQYNYLPKGYTAYDLWDETVFNFEGKTYEAIVLSSCGACFWEEKHQRVDIFVSPQGRFGNRIGEMTRHAQN